MKNAIFAISALLIFGFSCKKSSDPASTPSGTDPYMNTAANSTWDYELTDSSTATVKVKPYTLTSTSQDSTIEGKSYHVYTNSNGNIHEYYNISGSEYNTYVALPVNAGGKKFVNLYLKDNLGANNYWPQTYKDTVSGVDLIVTETNTIKDKAIDKTVNGIVYTNVIHVVTTFQANALSGLINLTPYLVTDIHSYYAPKYGLIQTDYAVDFDYPGSSLPKTHVNTHTKLISAVLHKFIVLIF